MAVFLVEGSPRAGCNVDENVLGVPVAFHRQALRVRYGELRDEARRPVVQDVGSDDGLALLARAEIGKQAERGAVCAGGRA
ncbi:hypothetical protein GCM10011579_098160 [Streptomyces albiflavescens]|uniref:Uncharacterized protein n=2 Tax=Streptomyces albiflavescens TaxID=1623582 RepID=A0A917YFT4_9ACTN|nr:hypothetical protein GCM10011579_098160 [Streptomyces albiflavescens]